MAERKSRLAGQTHERISWEQVRVGSASQPAGRPLALSARTAQGGKRANGGGCVRPIPSCKSTAGLRVDAAGQAYRRRRAGSFTMIWKQPPIEWAKWASLFHGALET
ncbi:hypothetical protein HL42_4894 [Trichophyton rubrum]|nr:hypothetical protein HL42_4894 [Trichophyton rubrum]